MAKKTVEIFEGKNFGIVHDRDEEPNTLRFALHNHDDIYEVVMLLDGDCEFCVEGNTYKLNPGDIVFTRPFELHRIVCLSERTYERIILYIKTDFFRENGCEKYFDIFENREIGTGNLIAQNIKERSLIDCMRRLDLYREENEHDVAEKVVYEFLYLINRYRDNISAFCTRDERVRKIIMYINDHLTENISLDILAKRFFMRSSTCARYSRKIPAIRYISI